jgi:phage tail sheath protein FI
MSYADRVAAAAKAANLPYIPMPAEVKGDPGVPYLCTNFGEFATIFGGFPDDAQYKALAHAVYGFFANGGTRCWVAAINNADPLELRNALVRSEGIDEIAIVAIPGLIGDQFYAEIPPHCEKMKYRFSILDIPENVHDEETGFIDTQLLDPRNTDKVLPDNSKHVAVYFPWLQVFDPATKYTDPSSSGSIFVPPSGHMAGVYARTDTQRGVHKAPANTPVLGITGVKYQISKEIQGGLNPNGINCIRELNGAIKVWGARTLGGDSNGEWKYVNVRRTFIYIGHSLDLGTQWVVFEPNDTFLWAKIRRNVGAFLTGVWRSGALFGTSPDQAFYVKCDAETNPPTNRELGMVVTEIGVAIVRPAEFVIFRLSQWQPEQ